MQSILSVVSLVVAIAALTMSVHLRLDPPRTSTDYGAQDPRDVVPALMSVLTEDAQLHAYQAHYATNRDEILRSLEVVDVSESGDHAIAFFRYSIGTEVFRDACWAGKVNGRWYLIANLSEYSSDKPKDAEWFKKMLDKREKWEKESAPPRFR